MRIRFLRPLALVCLASSLLVSPAPALAGGIGVSSAPCLTSADTTAQATASVDWIPFHYYKVPPQRGRRANRDYDFLWSDTYRGRFGRPLDALTGPEQLNDMDRLGQVASEFPGVNALGLPWTNFQLTYNFLAGRRQLKNAQGQWFDRDTTYVSDEFAPIGFRVAQTDYPDVERDHFDVYVYAPSFASDGPWNSYHGDGGTDTNWAPNYGKFMSDFVSPAEDSLTTGGVAIYHGNALQIPGPLPSQVGGTNDDPTRWSRPRGLGNAALMHEGQHALDLNDGLHMFASAAEALTGVNTDAPRWDVDYHYSLSPTNANIGNAYPHWQSFMAWLAFNWRGADTTAAGWTDDLVRRWVSGPSAERNLPGLAKRLRNSECPECAEYPGFAGLDSLARVQRLIHDWRVANYVNNPTLPGGKYGFPPQFGFSPANDLGAWQNVDGVTWDDGYAVPPVETLGPTDVNHTRWYSARPAGPGFVSRPLRLSMFGAEYFVFKADPALTGNRQLRVAVRPAPLRAYETSFGCAEHFLPQSGRVQASVVTYSQAADSLFRHPEWATGVTTQSVVADSLGRELVFDVPTFGSTTKVVLVVLTLGDGPQGYYSTGDQHFEVKDSLAVNLGVTVHDGVTNPAPVAVAATAEAESAPAWSPDGTRIAYRLRGDTEPSRIYVRAASGTAQATPLRTATNGQHDPAWSPRGDRVAYVDGRDEFPEGYVHDRRVWLVDPETGTPQQLTTQSGLAHEPAFSPNGAKLAYLLEWTRVVGDTLPRDSTSSPEWQPPVTVHGWDVRLVDVASGSDDSLRAFDGQAPVRGLRWAPDGRFLTFSRYDGQAQRYRLHSLDLFTGALTLHDAQAPAAITRELAPGRGALLVEEQSGASLRGACDLYAELFCECVEHPALMPAHWIAVRDTLAGTSTPIAYRTGAELSQPRWSPDGTKVAYVTTQNGNPDVFVAPTTYDRAPYHNHTTTYYQAPACESWEYLPMATDPDCDPITYEVFDLPPGAVSGPNGMIVWQYPVIGHYWMIARALDQHGAVASRVIHLEIVDQATCGGGGGEEDPGPGEEYGVRARQAGSTRVFGDSYSGPARVVNTLLDAAPSGEWVSQTVRLAAARADSAGQVRTQLVARRPGSFQIDRARLLVADHAPGTVAVATESGVAAGPKRRAARLTLGAGAELTSELSGAAGTARLIPAGAVLTAEWAAGDGVDGLLVDCARASAADPEQEWGVRIELPTGTGWSSPGLIHPRTGFDALAVPLAATSTVRLAFVSDTYVREVAGFTLGDTASVTVTPVELDATNVEGGVEQLTATDSTSVALALGQRLTMLFEGPPPSPDRQRTLFLDLVASFTPEGGAAPAGNQAIESLPTQFTLHGNRPNPFGRGTTIHFDVPRSAAVRLEVFDAQGRRVRTLTDRAFEPGTHSLVWDGSDASGQRVRPGVYLYRMTTDGFRDQRRMVLLGH